MLNNKKEVAKESQELKQEMKILWFKHFLLIPIHQFYFFQQKDLVYKVKAWKIPEGSANSKGKSLFNILPLKNHQSISSIMPFPEDESEWKNLQIVFATSQGKIRKNSLEDFSSINASGKIAMKLR